MRAYAVGRHPSFERDFRKQIEWWMARSPARAEAIVDALEAASRRLSEFPEIGHPVQVGGVWLMTTRSYAVGETGYVVRYKVDHASARITLTRFRHERQRPLKPQGRVSVSAAVGDDMISGGDGTSRGGGFDPEEIMLARGAEAWRARGVARAPMPATTRALAAWKEYRLRTAGEAAVAADAPVFVNKHGNPISESHLARQYREHLQAAGVDRADLFEQSERRRHVWLHSARAAFVTVALANDKSETWVADRTCHNRAS
jgi:plasmid stabilization system protein ParE